MAERQASFPHPAPIEAYGNGGFRFAGMSHRGSLLCLPSGIYAWNAVAAATLTLDDFAQVLGEAEAVELLLLGTGRMPAQPAANIGTALADAGIRVEAMDTGAACRTWNVLLGEGRPVGAALIAVD